MSDEKQTDVTVLNEGTIVLFVLNTEAAQEWVEENVDAPDYLRFGGNLAVEHRFAEAIIHGMLDAGLDVR